LRAISLFGVLVTAKVTTMAAFGQPGAAWPMWWVPALFWQDALVAAGFYGADALLRRPRLAWTAYALVSLYVAINVPIALVLSTPLTRPMLRAAAGPLTDSIAHYLSAANLAGAALAAGVAVFLPRILAGFSAGRRVAGALIAAAIVLILIGPFAATRADTRGLHRNAVSAMVGTLVPRTPGSVSAPADSDGVDWRRSPFGGEGEAGEDLTALRGAARGRSVILVVLESTAARYLGLYGASPDPMPVLSRLAADAVVVDRAYAVYPESIKGLFATLCSRYPGYDTDPEIYAAVPCESLAARLRSAGYATALFHSGRFDYLGMRATIDGRGFDILEDAGAIGGRVHSSFGVDDESTIDRMLRWIDDRRGQPFFAAYLPVAGHHPYAVSRPGPFTGDRDFDRYLNAMHESDLALGRLVDGLAQRGLDRRTLLVIAGDHGQAFNQHPGNIGHTLYAYDENVRVPYLLVAPGIIHGSRRLSRLASVVDTAPTILDLLGMPPSSGHQGTSLLEPGQRMALFYTDYSRGWLGLADGCWKFLHEVDAGRSSLYDICVDPDESSDLAAQKPERVNAYRAHVERWAAAQKTAIEAR
jgi:phosphoglycerol transferase MdoB-like AlkP superfamily enzyme